MIIIPIFHLFLFVSLKTKTKKQKTEKGKQWGIYRALKSDKNTLWVHLETTYLVETENFLLKIL